MKSISFLLFLFTLTFIQCTSSQREITDNIRKEFFKQQTRLLRVSNDIVINDIVHALSIDTVAIDSLIHPLTTLYKEFYRLEQYHDKFTRELEIKNKSIPQDSIKYFQLKQELCVLANDEDNKEMYDNTMMQYDLVKNMQSINIEVYALIYSFKNKNEIPQVPLYAVIDHSQTPYTISFHTTRDNDLFNSTCVGDYSEGVCPIIKLMLSISYLTNYYKMKLSLISRINSMLLY